MLRDWQGKLVPKDAPTAADDREHTFSGVEYLGHGVVFLLLVSLVYGGIGVGLPFFFASSTVVLSPSINDGRRPPSSPSGSYLYGYRRPAGGVWLCVGEGAIRAPG